MGLLARPKVVIIFVILFAIVGFFWALLASAGIWLLLNDPEFTSNSDNISGGIFALGISISSVVSHFASAAVLFSGKRPKKLVIILVIINIITNIILILAIPALLPFFVPVIIFNIVFLILLQKNKELEKYVTEIYRSPKPQQAPKPQQTLKPQNIRCSNCNTIVDSSNKFCKKCGTSLSNETRAYF